MSIVPLNIMLTYPVRWTKQQVLRDIVQNFYDDAGAAQFGKKFQFEFCPEGQLKMVMKSAGFDYRWLVHLGASSKQEKNESFAGFYGEGFKIAALCALRDYGWRIALQSKDWSIQVDTVQTAIEGKPMEQLAYQLEENLPVRHDTILIIENFHREDAPLMDEVLMGFYYPENPLIGELICQNEYMAIHRRSARPKPDHFISSYNAMGDGIIFLRWQARGSFMKPLVICHHRFRLNDRDRKEVSLGVILDVLLDLVDLADCKDCFFLLEELDKYWYDYPESRRDVDSWYSLIRKILRKLHYSWADAGLIEGFCRRHPNLVVCDSPNTQEARNQKRQALAWRKLHLPESRLVQDSFSFFGYPDLIYLCEAAGGFNLTRQASVKEVPRLRILHDAAKEILDGMIPVFPDCVVIENDSSVYGGTASITRKRVPAINGLGQKVRYDMRYIAIKKNLLRRDKFMEAFSTYCHELCHCFGGDASAPFSRALTDVITRTAERAETLQGFHKRWARLGKK